MSFSIPMKATDINSCRGLIPAGS